MMREYNYVVEDIFPGKKHEGEIGIEIEVEGQRLPQEIPSYWSVHQDGSLRGESAEYVLQKPVRRELALRFLQYLKKKLDDYGAIPVMSNRTSVHVHLNMQGLAMRQVYSVICTYLLFEDLLTEFAGPDRVGNLFCLRAQDAEYLIDTLVGTLQRSNWADFGQEGVLRYASVNICALRKFNSLEFRALRGTVDPDTIYTWIRLLLAVKDAGLIYPDPRTILQSFSALGPIGFTKRIFPDDLSSILLRAANFEQRLWEGARLCQDIAYAVEWEIPERMPKPRVFNAPDPEEVRQPRAPARGLGAIRPHQARPAVRQVEPVVQAAAQAAAQAQAQARLMQAMQPVGWGARPNPMILPNPDQD